MRPVIKAQFLEITASVSLRVLRQIVEAAIQQAFARPDFWMEQFHVFAAVVDPTPSGLMASFQVADIADANGFLSPKLTEDQMKALLLPVLADTLAEQARRLVEREVWLRSVHVLRVNRNPGNSLVAEKYRRWLGRLS